MSLLPIPLALRILIHRPGRLIVSIAGILLAVVLMLSQAGFRHAMFDSQTELIQRLNADLVMVGRLKFLLYAPEPFPSRRLYQVGAVPGVRAVYPLYIENFRAIWKNPHDNSLRPLRVLAFNPDDPVFDFPGLKPYTEALKQPDTIIFDEKSRDYYGHPRSGDRTELSRKAVNVVGTFQLGTDFMTDGNLIMSDRNFLKFFPERFPPGDHLAKVEIGLIRLEPGADRSAVQRQLNDTLLEDVRVLTKPEFAELEARYWRDTTAIGYIFTLGMVVGFVVGVIICYQILYTNVANYLPQFATLKAMGCTDRYLIGIVLQQGLFLAVLGFLPAVPATLALFWAVSDLTGLQMHLTPLRAAFILILTVAMCQVSGVLAVRRIRTADPAEVFK